MSKIPVGQLHSLSIRDLTNGNPLLPGAIWRGEVNWRYFSVGIRISNDGVWLSYRWREYFKVVEKQDRIEFSWLTVGYGTRAYFQCPVCGRRCGKIFLNFGRWACKQCAEACSDGCNSTPTFRRLGQLEKLKRRLGAKGGNPIARPRYMHRKTFHRLYDKARLLCDECSGDMAVFMVRVSKSIDKLKL